ncbi:tetratricopeptide repeat protein [Maricaulis alexandrii]|uniref:tetratricopeptide repeat protein n=1 Tax=Maricaulis alexandrii TaxID=2570354 RepID=UPI001486D878|nr:tetratricopeptide repeat protein [Maricaulis alexandrii]
MVDIFEEVDEELRKDKYQELLRKYGPWALGGAIGIIAVAAGYQWFQASSLGQREASSDAMISAIRATEENQLALAATGFETLAETGVAGYPALALLQRGSVALEQGDMAAAADFFEQAAAATSEPVVRDMAEIRAVWARWDSLSAADVEIRLQPLTGDTSPYRFLARETIGAAALRDGDLVRARSAYQFISFAFEAPDGVRRRAQEALAIIERDEALAAPAASEAETEAAPADTPDATHEDTSAGDSGDD